VQIALGTIITAVLVGGVLGTFIRWGIQCGDDYGSQVSQQDNEALLRVQTDPQQAARAAEILARVARETRAKGRQTPA